MEVAFGGCTLEVEKSRYASRTHALKLRVFAIKVMSESVLNYHPNLATTSIQQQKHP
jgi:hypothetical protein